MHSLVLLDRDNDLIIVCETSILNVSSICGLFGSSLKVGHAFSEKGNESDGTKTC